jgi:predicted TIM-barrel fold metal-dependent hydrolase
MHSEPSAGWDCHVHVFDAQTPVMPGHYRPAPRLLGDIERLAQGHGFGHLVLVQPSVYGTDNSVLLRSLSNSRGRHRGVVVIDPDTEDLQLRAMHSLGVRGVRFNLVSPVGNGDGPESDFLSLAPRLRALGWHVQWYARPQDLPLLAALHEGSGVPAVLDHLAGISVKSRPTEEQWQALAQLAQLGGWMKLSGWYRLGAMAPYTELDETIRRVAAVFEGRLLWGSDWPHTTFFTEVLPPYESTWEPVARTLDATQQASLREASPARLYG